MDAVETKRINHRVHGDYKYSDVILFSKYYLSRCRELSEDKRRVVNFKMVKTIKIILVSILLLVLIICELFAVDNNNTKCTIGFHNVITAENTDVTIKPDTGYDSVKKVYPNSNLESWYENSCIKKKPSLIFNAKDIISIKIIKQPYAYEQYRSCYIVFYFKPSASKMLYDYTNNRIGTYQAITINNNLFSIAKVLEATESEMHITSARRTTEELKAQLLCLSKNIVVKEEEKASK